MLAFLWLREIVPYREGERAERGEVTIEEAAEALTVIPAFADNDSLGLLRRVLM
jgi:hypothetical protein